MSLQLNGTTQYVDLGAVDIRSATPLTFAFVGRMTAGTTGLVGIFSQGQYDANTGYGFFMYGSGPPHPAGVYVAADGTATVEIDGATGQAAEGDWILFIGVIYTTGAAPNITFRTKFQTYNFTTLTWSSQEDESILANRSATGLTVPTGSQHTFAGAANTNTGGSTANKFWKGDMSWIALFNNDMGAFATQIKDTAFAAELVANGFWNSLDANCKLAIAFNNNTTDQSGNGYNGTLIGSPSYGTTGPGETDPGGGTTFTQSINITSSVSMSIPRLINKIITANEPITLAINKYISRFTTINVNTAVQVTKTWFNTISMEVNTSLSITWQQVDSLIRSVYRNIASIVLRTKNTDSISIRGSDDAEL